MASFLWQEQHTVIKQNKVQFQSQQFFHKLWSLQRYHQTELHELIRFQVVPELKFFGTDVIAIERYDHGATVKYKCKLNFMGLIGTYGVLPVYFKELMLVKEHTQLMQVMYDLLQQRSLQLAYEAWSRRYWYSQIFVEQSPLSSLISSLTQGKVKFAHKDEYYAKVVRYFCAYFLSRHRPLDLLEKLLTEMLQTSINILPMQGTWINLPKEQRSYLGSNPGGSFRLELGINTILGKKIWCVGAALNIRVKLLEQHRIIDFLPGGGSYEILRQLILLFTPQKYQWFLIIELPPRVLVPCKLTPNSWNRLGQLSVLGKYQGLNDFIINLGVIKDESN
jgi:type VI secretion system protein ImpH